MSKSKGNVVDPLTMTEKYGTDALRNSLVYGIAPASDFVVSEDKIRAQRNFVNKIWNASRFVLMIIDRLKPEVITIDIDESKLNEDDKYILSKLGEITKSTTKDIETFHFGRASENLYQFFWHEFCDIYIEKTKDRGVEVVPVLLTVLINSLKLMHPFMPFVTENVYQEIKKIVKLKEERLIVASWPK